MMQADLSSDCLCDENHLCSQPACIAERAEEAARWFAIFEDSPDPVAYTAEDLRAFDVYGDQPYKYEDAV